MANEYTRWCARLSADDFHAHVAGRLQYPGDDALIVHSGKAWPVFLGVIAVLAGVGLYTIIVVSIQ